jgi:TPR repeat protein
MKILLTGLVMALWLWAGVAGAQDADAFFKGVQAYRTRDYVRAASCFEQAAEQGDSEAQFLLGRMHYDGNSLSTDYVTAYQWFAIAAETGQAVASRYRDGLARKMTEAEVTEGARRAATWLAQHPLARGPERN